MVHSGELMEHSSLWQILVSNDIHIIGAGGLEKAFKWSREGNVLHETFFHTYALRGPTTEVC